MKVINLGQKNSLLNKFVAQLRDINIQKDSLRFRKNLERIGNIFAYEISQVLESSVKPVATTIWSSYVLVCAMPSGVVTGFTLLSSTWLIS